MKYEALYSDKAKERMREVAASLIRMDDYYPIYHPYEKWGVSINDKKVKAVIVNREPIGYYIPYYGEVVSMSEFSPPNEWFEGKAIRWRTCANNIIQITFEPQGVRVMMEGRRHGIPFIEALKDIETYPKEVLRYETWRPDWMPWENLHEKNDITSKTMTETRCELALSDIGEMLDNVVALLKKHGFKQIDNTQTECTKFYHEDEGVTVTLEAIVEETIQKMDNKSDIYYPLQLDGVASRAEYIIKIRFYNKDNKLIDEIEERRWIE